MGIFGLNTRVLAEKLGSFLSYTTETGNPEILPGAPGMINPRDLVEKYRFRDINSKTDIYGVVGFPLTTTFSPQIYNTVFSREKINAVYIPFPAQSLNYFLELADTLNIKGAAVTIPYKEEIINHLGNISDSVRVSGACNTIKALGVPAKSIPGEIVSKVWGGTNTDTLGFSESLLGFLGKKHLRGQKITVIGAGGAARAIVSEISRLKGKCLILNRNAVRARELALNYGYAWGGLDSQSLDSMERYSDIIIQTTPVGTSPNTSADPFELYHFNGHETVMDIIYNPIETTFLKRAMMTGCRVLNGMDMLFRQAKYQYEYILDRDFPEQIIPALLASLQKKQFENTPGVIYD
jgi:3-dehydroquinate dehydratase/shikimate dehydrogenase